MDKDPRDLTIGDCRAAGHMVYLSCDRCRVGRHLDLTRLEKWSDSRIIDLAEAGKFVCGKCRAPSTFVSLSAHLVRDPILTWQKGS